MSEAQELVALPNGVRVAFDPMPGLATAAVGVWIKVGARWERAEEAGVAHLFEHMAFKGAGERDARAFAEASESVGAYVNAATGYERTSYYARCLMEDAPFCLDLVADIVLAPHWRAEDLEKEKNVVYQEMGEAFDQPDDRVFETHQALVFPNHPLGRPILGAKETLAKVTVATLEAFRDRHLTPDRVVISIAGAYDRAAILEKAEHRFGALLPAEAPKPQAALVQGGAGAEQRKLEQTHLALSLGAPGSLAPEIYAAQLLAEILGGGASSRLFQEVRESRGLAYTISAFIDTYEDVGRLGVYAGCAAKDAKTVAALTAEAVQELAAHGPTQAELARAKATMRAQLLMGAEAPQARAEARANQALMRGRLAPFAEMRAKYEAVTARDVQAAAAAALLAPAAAAAIGPKAGLGAAEGFVARFA